MHYRVNGMTIKSENAAKPVSQPNKYLLDKIQGLPSESYVLDYGCGKFRYTIPLSHTVQSVDAIDSREQLLRTQIINGVKTNLVDYAATFLSNVKVYNVESTEWRKEKYDIAICANVLSTVPQKATRLEILKDIKTVLKDTGVGLVCVQYRNSYFSGYANRSYCERWYDGWLMKGKRGSFFYGLIQPADLKELCIEAKLEVIETDLYDGTVYLSTRAKKIT